MKRGGGVFLPCSVATTLTESKYFDLPKNEKLHLDDYKTSDELKEALRELYLLNYTEACNFCTFFADDRKLIDAGEQLDGTFRNSEYTVVKRSVLQDKDSYIRALEDAKEYHIAQSKAWQKEVEKLKQNPTKNNILSKLKRRF